MSEAAPSNNVIQEYFINIFRYKYIQYHGRARRKEYWMFTLFYSISYLILALALIPTVGEAFYDGVSALYSLGTIVPSFCLSIRRLHDIGKSGWWLFLWLLPVIGWIVLFVFACLDSQPGENQYGPNPKEA